MCILRFIESLDGIQKAKPLDNPMCDFWIEAKMHGNVPEIIQVF